MITSNCDGTCNPACSYCAIKDDEAASAMAEPANPQPANLFRYFVISFLVSLAACYLVSLARVKPANDDATRRAMMEAIERDNELWINDVIPM
jgi:hypothetical protein